MLKTHREALLLHTGLFDSVYRGTTTAHNQIKMSLCHREQLELAQTLVQVTLCFFLNRQYPIFSNVYTSTQICSGHTPITKAHTVSIIIIKKKFKKIPVSQRRMVRGEPSDHCQPWVVSNWWRPIHILSGMVSRPSLTAERNRQCTAWAMEWCNNRQCDEKNGPQGSKLLKMKRQEA